MSNTSDITPSIFSNEHYEFLQLNQVGRLSERTAKVMDAEEQSLRQFNAELLQKIGEFRKKNLELAGAENDLKTKLAQVSKGASDKERELTAKYTNEIETLKARLNDLERTSQDTNDEWSRKLSKLSDESWAQGLENENLRRVEEELEQKLLKFQADMDRSLALEDAQKTAIDTLTSENARISAELSEAEQAKTDVRKSFEQLNIQLAKVTETTREREMQMVNAYEALRSEYANMDRCYNESNTALVKLQSEMRERYKQHEDELQELTTYLTEKAASDSAAIRDENAKMREQLAQRDTRLDADKTALSNWKDQLTSLDQHLKQFSDKLKKGKSEMIRIAKSLEDEVLFAVTHPFTEYLEMADLEIGDISKQITSTSSMSPLKAKLDTRLQQANQHREGIQAILDKSDKQLNDHAKSIQTVIKSFEFLT